MRASVKFIPYGTLPYDNIQALADMQTKLSRVCPFLPVLPAIEKNVSILSRTISGFPFFKIKHETVAFKQSERFIEEIGAIYNSPTIDNTEPYRIQSPYKETFLKTIKQNNSKYACVYLYGPFSLSQIIRPITNEPFDLANKLDRKFLIQLITIKALSILYEIKNAYKETTPIIIFEEPLLNNFCTVNRDNPDITMDIVISMYTKIFKILHQAGVKVGVRSMEKCNWTIPINAGVDIISIDAYHNPHNLNIIVEDVNAFLSRGGSINYAIVPMTSISDIQKLNLDNIYVKLLSQLEDLISAGISRKKLIPSVSISIYGSSDRIQLLFAEKAYIVAANLAKKLINVQNL